MAKQRHQRYRRRIRKNHSEGLRSEQQVKILEKHPLWIRWAHWVNFPLLSLMAWSGVLIYWANPAYPPVLPDAFYDALGLSHHLATGIAVHFFVMWFFVLNGCLYLIYLAASGEWRELAPKKDSFQQAWQVLLHDLGLTKTLPPQGKFNAAQRIAYSSILLVGMGSVLTGLAIYKPVQLHFLTSLFLGYESARLFHFLFFIGACTFFVLHITQVVRAGWKNFKGMVTGFEIKEDE